MTLLTRFSLLLFLALPALGADLIAPPAMDRSVRGSRTVGSEVGSRLADEVSLRSGATVLQEASRWAATAAMPAMTTFFARHLPAGLGAFLPRVIGTAVVYAGFKTGWDLSGYADQKLKGRPAEAPSAVEIGMVAAGATAGSLLLGRILGPTFGSWIGEWIGWSLAETMYKRWRGGEGLNPIAALKSLDIARVTLTAVGTEATGHFILKAAGVDRLFPGATSATRFIAALGARVVGMAVTKTTVVTTYDRWKAGHEAPEASTARESLTGADERYQDDYRRLIQVMREGPKTAGQLKSSLKALETSEKARTDLLTR